MLSYPRWESKSLRRRFFIFCEDLVKTSDGNGEECRVFDLSEFDRDGHGPSTGQGNPPASRARAVGEREVRMEPAEQDATEYTPADARNSAKTAKMKRAAVAMRR